MPHIELSFLIPAVIIAALVLVAIAISAFFYRHTLPPVSPGKRLFLTILRGAALSLLLILLFEPLLRLVYTTAEPPLLAVLVDSSRSMKIVDKAGDRAATLSRALSETAWRQLPNGGQVRFYAFGSNVRQVANENAKDSLTVGDDATNIAVALGTLADDKQRANIQAAVLLSDGSYNIGQNPLYVTEQLGLPLFTVGIGDSTEQKDVLVTKVVTNELVYSQTEVPVDVTIRSSGFRNDKVEVSLSEGGKEVKRASLTLAEETREYTVQLSYLPEGEGTKKYTVAVSSLPGELTAANNRRHFFVKVLKSKLNVLLVAGGPSPDVSVVRQSLGEQRNFNVRAFIQRSPSGFYEGPLTTPQLDSADCIIFIGFPTAATPNATLDELRAAVGERSKPLLFVDGKSVDPRKLAVLSETLPYRVDNYLPSEQLVFAEPAAAQGNHPILRVGDAGGRDAWERLPPIFAAQSSYKAKPEATVLAFSKINTVVLPAPLILIRHVNRQKSLAVLGYGIWRWRLMAQGNAATENFLPTLLSNGIRWLTTREEDRPVRVVPTKESFTQGEPVEFEGQVYDASAHPVDNAQVKVMMRKEGREFEAFLRPIGTGRYEGAIEGLQAGDYVYRAVAHADGQNAGEDKGRFSVGELNLEFQDTRMNVQLLRQLAHRTGGEYLHPAELSRLPSLLASIHPFASREVRRAKEVELWNWRYMLGMVVLLFGVEWFTRKKSGML